MAFNDKEISTQDGRRIALYALRWGNTWWRYTSADRKITREELVANVMTEVEYLPVAMKDNGMVQGSSSQNDFTVDGPGSLPIADLFRGTPPAESIWLTVRRMHAGEDDAPITWKGVVLNVKRPTPGTCQIVGKPLIATMKRTGLRLCWSRECPHFLYDAGCKVDKETYRVDAEVTSMTATTFTTDADGDFRGGFVEWEVNEDGTIDRRFIDGQTGTTCSIFGLTDRLEVGMAVRLYPGCDRTPTMCNDRYENIDNYGGFDKMPGQSPFNVAIW